MKLLTFDSQHLDVDWISFNIQGLTDPKTIASNLSKYFTPHVIMDDVLSIGFHGFKKSIKCFSFQLLTSNAEFCSLSLIRIDQQNLLYQLNYHLHF